MSGCDHGVAMLIWKLLCSVFLFLMLYVFMVHACECARYVQVGVTMCVHTDVRDVTIFPAVPYCLEVGSLIELEKHHFGQAG